MYSEQEQTTALSTIQHIQHISTVLEIRWIVRKHKAVNYNLQLTFSDDGLEVFDCSAANNDCLNNSTTVVSSSPH